MNAIEMLYEGYAALHKESNEQKRIFAVVCDPKKVSFDESDELFRILVEGIEAETKDAFYSGFNAAVEMLEQLNGGVTR